MNDMSMRGTAGAIVTLAVLLGLLFSSVARAQVAGATMSGTITDESGAAIPGATISIKNVASGIIRDVVSNGNGMYTAPILLPGTYDVTVSLTGFARVVRKGIALIVGSNEVVNITLRVGSVAEELVVTAAAPTVDLASSTVSGYANETKIRELPLNGRDWTQLATLEPGVLAVRAQASTGSTANRGNRGFGNQLTDNGHRPYENTYRVNGININDYSNGSPGSVLGVNLGVDAIQEFTVLTDSYPAEYGRTSGAVINAA